MLIVQKIEQLTYRYNDARRTVGDFLLKERRKLNNYSMQEIADATYTSKSTLVRVAKNLGFSGWTDFISRYKQEIVYMDNHLQDGDMNIPFSQNDTYMQIAGKINTIKTISMKETLELLDEYSLTKAADILKSANRVCMFGVSVNSFLAQLFQHKMIQIGKPVEIITQSEMKLLSYTLKKGDCAIIISYSGNDENRMPISLPRELKMADVSIIGITSLGENLLRNSADCTLSIASRERLYSKIASYATESSIALLLDILYSCYFNVEYDKNMEYKIDISRKVERNRVSTSEGIMEENTK
ncbi:MurR/RpiR family transcriptional regulator [Peribacillus sp. NPDC096379]|uniref:MurR/RpiR family transcriptional regulator n=1 Tax=Peribacillus sp. NPDC096379 TaxID=3364393 RepID=UPI00381EDDBB